MHLIFSEKQKQAGGFTIIELLVVISVIGILAAITVVAYNGFQARGYDTSVQSDIDALDGLQTSYGLKNNVAGKAYYSKTTPTDSSLGFTVSPGNVIDVVIDSSDYCIRGYNLKGSRKKLSTAYTKESSSGACSRIAASALAQSDSP